MPDSRTGNRPAFQQLQYAFAAHLRDPAANPAPVGIEDRRMQVYRDLFYNNMQDYLANGFPVLRSLYDEQDWFALVRQFYAQHQSHSPQFYQIGAEFLAYLQDEHQVRACDPPFLFELAHYEWVEMILAIDPAKPVTDLDAGGDLLDGCPVVTPWLRNLSYAFDVQRISPSYRPSEPPAQPTFLAVYRKLDDEIVFLELNAVTAQLLQRLMDVQDRTGRQLLEELAVETGGDAQQLLAFGSDLLADLRAKQVLLGTRKV